MIHVVGLAIGGQVGDPVVGEGLRGGGVRHLKRNGASMGPSTVCVLEGGGGAGVETRRVGREGRRRRGRGELLLLLREGTTV